MFKKELIFQLSLLGLLMGFATVWYIPHSSEIYFWIFIFLYSAYRIGKIHRGNYFLHGVFVSILSSAFYTLVHFFFYDKYVRFHPEELAILNQLSLAQSPRIALLITSPVFGVIFGILQGTLAVAAHKLNKKFKKVKRSK